MEHSMRQSQDREALKVMEAQVTGDSEGHIHKI